jgi:phage tail protein X
MLAVGRVHADGEVTAAEAASLAVYLWPGLEGDAGRVASVISAIEHARKGMADDGKLTGEEVLEVTLDLLRALRDTIKISDLHGWARWVIEGVIGRRTNDRSAGP